MNILRAIQDRLIPSINRFSIRTVLVAGFSVIILSGMTTVLLTQWTAYLSDRTMDRFINVDNKIADLCLKSNAAMISVRRHEKDFLLNYRDFGFSETKSRYINRALTSIEDIKEFMKGIRLLTQEPVITGRTREVDHDIDQYKDDLLRIVEKYGMLGSFDTGLEGEMRNKAHEIEDILKQQGNNPFLTDLLSMRRREKDFIMRNRDADALEFLKAANRFKTDIDAAGIPAERKEEFRHLTLEYVAFFDQYVRTIEEIRVARKAVFMSAQTIEPILEKMYTDSLARVTAAKEDMQKTEKILWPVKAVAGLLVFIFSLVVALYVSRSISRSVIGAKAFAEDIASGNLEKRLTPKGENEFATLGHALNGMAESLQNAEIARKKSVEEIEQLSRFPNENIYPVMRVGKDGTVLYANKPSLPILETWECRMGQHLPETWHKFVIYAFNSGVSKNTEFEAKGRVYSLTFVPISGPDYVNIYGYDITERKKAEERLDYMAHFDALTGLPNRILLKDRLEQAIAVSRRSGRKAGVLFLDLDNFKNINDSFSHRFGDFLLHAVSERLKDVLRESDTIARIGGDEFIVLLSGIEGSNDAARVARKITESMREPFAVEDRVLNITASIGISLYPDDGDGSDTLIKNADTAMYRAKEVGRNNYQFFTQEMNDRVFERLSMENNLRRAIEREEFVLHYQPQVDIKTGKIIGTEALIRWQHPDMGLVPPGRFIHIAEDSGLIVPIGEWVLRTACRQNREWQIAGLQAIPVAVNLSAIQFRQPDFLEAVKRAVMDTEIDPRYVELELTERAVMQDVEAAVATMQEMKGMGFLLTIDDFGTGYSSLNYLKRFPIDKLKIDQSFVRDITTDPDDASITLAIISMAHSLGLRVIAEGVETAEQLAFLREHGCDEIQGYYFSKPVPADEFAGLLQKDILNPSRETGV